MEFYVGQKVVSVPRNPDAAKNDSLGESLNAGSVYTVSAASFYVYLPFGLSFLAIKIKGYETTWDARDFRPLESFGETVAAEIEKEFSETATKLLAEPKKEYA